MGTLAAVATQGPPFGLNLGTEPTLFRFPYVQNTTASSSAVLWATEETGAATAELSSDGRNFTRVTASSRRFLREETRLLQPFTLHQVNFANLRQDTMYSYRVSLNGIPLSQGRFQTAGTGPFVFNVIGDSGQRTPAQFSIARQIASERPAFLIHAGDIAYLQGNHLDFQLNHFEVYSFLLNNVPFFPVPGNHEYGTENAGPYLSMHVVPSSSAPPEDAGRYYSFDWGNAHFVCLDSNAPLQRAARGEGQMLQWLDNDLRQTNQLWRVAVIHHAPYATGVNEGDGASLLVRQYVVPILESRGVKVVLSGHEHSYQRSYPLRAGAIVPTNTGTLYFTTGGGGAFLILSYRVRLPHSAERRITIFEWKSSGAA